MTWCLLFGNWMTISDCCIHRDSTEDIEDIEDTEEAEDVDIMESTCPLAQSPS